MATTTWGNPYTQEEHTRETVKAADRHQNGCSWCGNEKNVLYRYDGRKGLFCNKGCYKDYHS